ncbi:MAG: ABC transporter permease [Planctomycetota bacterium]|nr:ABC transporter permease [Planctomycetota bacterium]
MTMDTFKKFFPAILLAALCIIFGSQRPLFFSVNNLMIILTQAVTVGTCALGLTFVILGGSIDLSIGSVVALSAVSCALVVPSQGLFAIAPAILTGMLCGAINGAVFSLGKVPSFIATMGGMVVFRGIVLIITKGRPIQIRDDFFLDVYASRSFGIPNSALITLIFVVFTLILLNRTPFGREVRAIGGGQRVAMLTGIKVTRIKLLMYVLAGGMYGVAGALQSARVMAATATMGEGLEMDVIAAVVVGGTPLTGGIGSIWGSILGTFLITILSNGMNMLGLSPYVQSIAKGIVLVAAVFLTIDRKKIGIIT